MTELTDHAEVAPSTEATQWDSVVALVVTALDRTGYGWLRRIAVTAEGGAIALRGQVPSFYLKQMAQTVVLAVPGVVLLRNELQVRGANS